MNYQAIYDIAEICSRKGIQDIVLCPGSRCAPFTLAFSRHGNFNMHVFSDERSAGFIAIGLAQQSRRTVAVVCTSGSALYNLAPAVAEAFFSEVSLLILSADRPSEWIGQHDGQTIFQQAIFGKHVKASYQLPQDYEAADNVWAINRMVNEAINLSTSEKQGPVHINAPFREPLYPSKEAVIHFSKDVRILEQHQAEFLLTDNVKKSFAEHWKNFTKALLVCGQHEKKSALHQLIRYNAEKHALPVLADILSNQHGLENSIQHADSFLGYAPEKLKESLQPELLITFGKGVISKQVKLFLRAYSPKAHWHIQEGGEVADTYQHLSHTVLVSAETFFTYLSTLDKKESFEKQKKENYKQLWLLEENKCLESTSHFFPRPDLTELEVVKEVLENLPPGCDLHLANSMSVRYANYIGLPANQSNITVYANRGTSGIDGCTSTVVGHCLANPTKLQVLITGDIAFFYDRNAFWHSYKLPNLRVVLLNNHGGVIFNLIDGPAELPEAEKFFITHQPLSAKHLCAEFGVEHVVLDSRKKLKNLMKVFFERDENPKILEVESDTTQNKTIFEAFKKKLKERYES